MRPSFIIGHPEYIKFVKENYLRLAETENAPMLGGDHRLEDGDVRTGMEPQLGGGRRVETLCDRDFTNLSLPTSERQ